MATVIFSSRFFIEKNKNFWYNIYKERSDFLENYIKIRIAAHADKVIKKYGKGNVLGVFL